jgi:hypothetical protein
MNRRKARLAAAGLWIFGVGTLFMLALNLDPAGLGMLCMGMSSLATATWINSVTGSAAPEEPQPSNSSAPAP